MSTLSFSCPLCGHAFDPSANAGCASCPLSAGCRTVCCPNCGHSTVDPRDSRLARWAAAALARLSGPRPLPVTPAAASVAEAVPLSQVPAPSRVRVVALAEGAGQRGARLRAYGLGPGASVEVIQQRPVTVVRIEHTELAIEAEIAAYAIVEPLE